jgi:hypothetical protein
LTIERMPTGSLPPPRVRACGDETSKHWPLRVASGNTMTYPYWSAVVT